MMPFKSVAAEVEVLIEKLKKPADPGAGMTVKDFAQTNDASNRKVILRDIASLRNRGNSAGPAVMKLLTDTDWEVRVAATRTLGYIGYKEAIDDLVKLLDRQDDWRLVFVAAESLGRLRAKQAAPTLSVVWNNHWYPPVCAAAGRALDAIGENAAVDASHADEPIILDFFEYEDDREKVDTLESSDRIESRIPVETLCNHPLTIKVRRKDGKIRSEEHVGVRTPSGYLIGTEDGKSGGALEFVDLEGNVQLISKDHTKAIYRIADEYLAITYLTDLSMNGGFVQKLKRSPEGRWTAEKWRALPGAPQVCWLMKNDKILVSCVGGIVLIAPACEMDSLTRKQVLGLRR
jgi:hypothetical protein